MSNRLERCGATLVLSGHECCPVLRKSAERLETPYTVNGVHDGRSGVALLNSYSCHDRLLPSRLGVVMMTTSTGVRISPLLGVPLHPLADPRRFV
jgi:hypothetical protein